MGKSMTTFDRKRVETISIVIVRRVRVDRTRTPQQVVDATGRRKYIDADVLATVPQSEGDEVDVYFIPTAGRIVRMGKIPAFLAQYGLVPDPRAQAAVNEADRAFADKYPNCTQWGNDCCLIFSRYDGERYIGCHRYGDNWGPNWFLSGVLVSHKR